jgi:hypothetical protein
MKSILITKNQKKKIIIIKIEIIWWNSESI